MRAVRAWVVSRHWKFRNLTEQQHASLYEDGGSATPSRTPPAHAMHDNEAPSDLGVGAGAGAGAEEHTADVGEQPSQAAHPTRSRRAANVHVGAASQKNRRVSGAYRASRTAPIENAPIEGVPHASAALPSRKSKRKKGGAKRPRPLPAVVEEPDAVNATQERVDSSTYADATLLASLTQTGTTPTPRHEPGYGGADVGGGPPSPHVGGVLSPLGPPLDHHQVHGLSGSSLGRNSVSHNSLSFSNLSMLGGGNLGGMARTPSLANLSQTSNPTGVSPTLSHLHAGHSLALTPLQSDSPPTSPLTGMFDAVDPHTLAEGHPVTPTTVDAQGRMTRTESAISLSHMSSFSTSSFNSGLGLLRFASDDNSVPGDVRSLSPNAAAQHVEQRFPSCSSRATPAGGKEYDDVSVKVSLHRTSDGSLTVHRGNMQVRHYTKLGYEVYGKPQRLGGNVVQLTLRKPAQGKPRRILSGVFLRSAAAAAGVRPRSPLVPQYQSRPGVPMVRALPRPPSGDLGVGAGARSGVGAPLKGSHHSGVDVDALDNGPFADDAKRALSSSSLQELAAGASMAAPMRPVGAGAVVKEEGRGVSGAHIGNFPPPPPRRTPTADTLDRMRELYDFQFPFESTVTRVTRRMVGTLAAAWEHAESTNRPWRHTVAVFDLVWNLLRIAFRPFSSLGVNDGAIREIPLDSWVTGINIMLQEGIAQELIEVFDTDLDADVRARTPRSTQYTTVTSQWLMKVLEGLDRRQRHGDSQVAAATASVTPTTTAPALSDIAARAEQIGSTRRVTRVVQLYGRNLANSSSQLDDDLLHRWAVYVHNMYVQLKSCVQVVVVMHPDAGLLRQDTDVAHRPKCGIIIDSGVMRMSREKVMVSKDVTLQLVEVRESRRSVRQLMDSGEGVWRGGSLENLMQWMRTTWERQNAEFISALNTWSSNLKGAGGDTVPEAQTMEATVPVTSSAVEPAQRRSSDSDLSSANIYIYSGDAANALPPVAKKAELKVVAPPCKESSLDTSAPHPDQAASAATATAAPTAPASPASPATSTAPAIAKAGAGAFATAASTTATAPVAQAGASSALHRSTASTPSMMDEGSMSSSGNDHQAGPTQRFQPKQYMDEFWTSVVKSNAPARNNPHAEAVFRGAMRGVCGGSCPRARGRFRNAKLALTVPTRSMARDVLERCPAGSCFHTVSRFSTLLAVVGSGAECEERYVWCGVRFVCVCVCVDGWVHSTMWRALVAWRRLSTQGLVVVVVGGGGCCCYCVFVCLGPMQA